MVKEGRYRQIMLMVVKKDEKVLDYPHVKTIW